MENAKWNGRLYTASEIKDTYELETQVRLASGRKEIMCPDPECPSPILRYCHGEQRLFFAHLNNCSCDYAVFDKANTPMMREVKHALYERFLSKGFDVQLETKLLPHHYTHILVTLPSGKKVAVELGTQAMSVSKHRDILRQYADAKVNTKWIVVSNTTILAKENDTFYLKRYSLNESTHGDVLNICWDNGDVIQYIVDPNQYLYKNAYFKKTGYSDIYSEIGAIDDLTFEGEDLTIQGFYTRYSEWLDRKRAAFKDWMREEDEKRKLRQNNEQKNKPKSNVYASGSNLTNNACKMSYDERRRSILPQMNQQEEQVRDVTGKRWLKCNDCGAVDTEDEFNVYGGIYGMNSGVCKKCSGKA